MRLVIAFVDLVYVLRVYLIFNVSVTRSETVLEQFLISFGAIWRPTSKFPEPLKDHLGNMWVHFDSALNV